MAFGILLLSPDEEVILDPSDRSARILYQDQKPYGDEGSAPIDIPSSEHSLIAFTTTTLEWGDDVVDPLPGMNSLVFHTAYVSGDRVYWEPTDAEDLRIGDLIIAKPYSEIFVIAY